MLLNSLKITKITPTLNFENLLQQIFWGPQDVKLSLVEMSPTHNNVAAKIKCVKTKLGRGGSYTPPPDRLVDIMIKDFKEKSLLIIV